MIVIESQKPTNSLILNEIRSHVDSEWGQLNDIIKNSLSRDNRHQLINDIIDHMIDNSGKRLRPLLGILIAKTFSNNATPTLSITLACIVELIHTATLLHDDVIDDSLLRRNHSSANAIWGNHAPILVGDYIYSIAIELLLKTEHTTIMSLVSPAITKLVEGEIMQLCNTKKECTKEDYFETIYRKTAILFEIACECSAISCQSSAEEREASKLFGRYLGLSFQIVDDILDYTADSNTLGKEIGGDIKQGKITLPLIYALDEIGEDQKTQLLSNIQKGRSTFNEVQTKINNTNAIKLCYEQAKHYHQQALEQLSLLPENIYREQLNKIIEFNLHRLK